MNADGAKRGGGIPPLFSEQGRQIGWITAGAVAVYLAMRLLPTGTNLNHMDFRVTGRNSIDFCDPLNPQFIPVVDVQSPVAMTIAMTGASRSTSTMMGADMGRSAVLTLKTASGKLIGAEDLLVVHTRKLHLLIVDASLEDYQHVHPTPGKIPGEWTFEFTPKRGGIYRVFADFTPVATGRGLYANADVAVGATAAEDRGVKPLLQGGETARVERSARPAVGPTGVTTGAVEREGVRFSLEPGARPVRAGQTVDLKFAVTRADGARVPLEPVMGAFAHLVAFDEGRRGFAHLHPMETDLLAPPDAVRPVLSFKITIPKAGRYVIWAQVNLGGRETFVPFWFDVAP